MWDTPEEKDELIATLRGYLGDREIAAIKLADHFGLELYYECNKPGVMGWWWEYRLPDGGKLNMEGDYISNLEDAFEDFYKAVGGYKGQEYRDD